MKQQNIVIVGLGRIGSAFLAQILKKPHNGTNLAYAVEITDTAGKAQAIAAGVKMVTTEELMAKGEAIDIIFDLTGIPDVRQDLRQRLQAANNHNTIIASESVARVIWSFISEDEMIEIEGRNSGY